MSTVIEFEEAKKAVETLREFLRAERCNLVAGGPCPADPEGQVAWYLSFYSEGGSAYMAFSHEGKLMQFGGTLGSDRYQAPPKLEWKAQ